MTQMPQLTAAHVKKASNGTTIATLYKDGKKVATLTPSGSTIKIPKEFPDGSLWQIKLAALTIK